MEFSGLECYIVVIKFPHGSVDFLPEIIFPIRGKVSLEVEFSTVNIYAHDPVLIVLPTQ